MILPVQPSHTPDFIYNDLKSKIQQGAYSLGERLPTEKQLAESYGVAVLTLRKALKRLRQDGWIVSRRYHGTHVSDPSQVRETSKVISLMIPYGLQTLSHPVFSRLVDGIEGILSEKGYELQLGVSSVADPAREQTLLSKIEDPAIGGWLIPSVISDKVRELLKKQPVPKILLHFPDEALSPHCLEVDYMDLASTVVNHLHAQGYRKICFVGPASARKYRDALIGLGGSKVGAAVEVISTELSASTMQAGREACAAVLADRQVDAFVCNDDEVAAGAMEAIKARGLKVPEIGVVGGGDFPLGVMTEPPLSTINYPYFQVGRHAAQLLIDIMEGKNVEPAHSRFVSKFISRGSSTKVKDPQPKFH